MVRTSRVSTGSVTLLDETDDQKLRIISGDDLIPQKTAILVDDRISTNK